MSHTPGPWRYYDEFILAGGEGRKGKVICEAQHFHFETDKEALANARLIASAPDLLKENEALKKINAEMLEVVREAAHCVHCVCGACPPAPCDTSEKAKAILKKLEVGE